MVGEPSMNSSSQRLAIDLGNAAAKWTLWPATESLTPQPLQCQRIAIPRDDDRPVGSNARASSSVLASSNAPGSSPSNGIAQGAWFNHFPWSNKLAEVRIGSVNRIASGQLQSFLAAQAERYVVHWVEGDDVPLTVRVREPSKLGIDRLLGGWAAWSLAGASAPVVVIDAGSAVTVDLVADTTFIGGAIMPGTRLMFQSLKDGTDGLPLVGLSDDHDHTPMEDPLLQDEVPGRDTVAAIRLGVAATIAGGVDRLIDTYARQQAKPIRVFVTGGDAAWLAKRLMPRRMPCRVEVVADLVLRGLLLL
jgi:type III pantothenate kinase